MSVGHYENFPVASWLMPARLRPAVRAIYRFARTADDIADEGDAAPAERLAALDVMKVVLDEIEAGRDGGWPDLAAAVQQHQLPVAHFRHLLSAFAQDVTVKRYPDYPALYQYCARSANPIGRLLLALYQVTDELSLQQSDHICTGLQLTNLWQDVAIDWKKDRVYLPQSELARFDTDEQAIATNQIDSRWRTMLGAQTAVARTWLESGAPLARRLPGRIGWELRLVVQGGLQILRRIESVDGDVFERRPQLGGGDWLKIAARALTT